MKKWSFTSKTPKKLHLSSFLGGFDYLKDDMVIAQNIAKDCYNFDTFTGALTTPRGISKWRDEEGGVRTVAYFRRYENGSINRDKFVVVTNDGEVYAYGVDSFRKVILAQKEKVEGLSFSDTPQIISYNLNGDDVLLFCSESNGTFVWDGKNPAYKIEGIPAVTSIAVHNERVFITSYQDPKALWFSDDLDPTNWNISLSEAGFIRMDDERGEVRKVVSFGGYLYVFRENGISRVTANSDQASFSVTHLYTSGGKILPNTVIVCENRIMFCSSEGIFAFDGESARKILPLVTPIFEFFEFVEVGYYEGKFYLSTLLNYYEGVVGVEKDYDYLRNVVFVYDLHSGKYMTYRGLDIKKIIPISYLDRLVFITEKGELHYLSYDMGKIGDEVLPARWKMPKTDFGSSEVKHLKRLTLYTDKPITIKIESDTDKREFSLQGSKRASEIMVNMTGSIFSLEILASDKASRIVNLTLYYA